MHKLPDIILVDDHSIFRKGIRTLIELEGIGKVIAEAENGDVLLKLLETHNPDIILMDIEMPVMNGMEASRVLAEKFPGIKIIILSMYDSDHFNTELVMHGVKGILRKSVDIVELKRAIHDVATDNYYIPIDIMNRVIVSKREENRIEKLKEEAIQFTERDIELIQWLCRGLSTREIAKKMKLAPKTVENYRIRLLQKTGSSNTVSLAVYAIKHGLVSI